MANEGQRRKAIYALGCLGLIAVGGVFAILGLFAVAMQPDAPVEVTVEATEADTPAVAEADTPDLAPATYAVSGIVIDEAGGLLPDVQVRARARLHHEASTETDADGAFTLDLTGPATLSTRGYVTKPSMIVVGGPRDDLVFRLEDRCPVDVLVIDSEDAPVEGAVVRPRARLEGFESASLDKRTTDVTGRVTLDHAPCRVLSLRVSADGFPRVKREGIDATEQQEVHVQLPDGIVLRGTVRDGSALPIEDAGVSSAGQSTSTDEEGAYELVVAASKVRGVRAHADGYRTAKERLRLAEGEPGPVVQDLVLEPSNTVTVKCLGLPDDSCETVLPVLCTRTFLPWGPICTPGTPTECDCPDGAAAIRGGGRTTLVPPGAHEATLDFRDGGGIRGVVHIDGEPTPCRVTVTYLPDSVGDLKSGLAGIRVLECLPDGSFEALGLADGGYHVDAASMGINKAFSKVEVAGEVVDLGLIELEAGGTIEGFVVDGKTKEPALDQMVIAYGTADPNSKNPPMGQAVSGPGGAFRIVGLDDGPYDVILAMRPFEQEHTTVAGGTAPELILETSGTGLLTDQGFELETDGEGGLVVSNVLAEGRAAAAGLQEGDVLTGITFMGFDPSEMLGDMAPMFTDLIIDNFTGQGVGLNVLRDGQPMQVELE